MCISRIDCHKRFAIECNTVTDVCIDYLRKPITVKAKAEKKPVDIKSLADRMQAAYRRDNERNKQGKAVKENMEATAPTPQPWDGANNPDDTIPAKRSARLKLLLGGKKTVKEDLYDHEKEDKSVATYGKKPKLEVTDKKESMGEKKPQAAAVLSGGVFDYSQ